MNALTTINFNFQETHQIRVIIDEQGNPQFVAKDVASALGYVNISDAISRFCKGVAKHDPLQTEGGNQNVRVIYEPDVYRLVFGSKLDSAVKFQDWVFEEVLPAIRKTGGYNAELTKPIKDYSREDLQHLKHIYTIPQLATVLNTSETHALKRMYDSYDNQPMQPSLFANDGIPPHIQKVLAQFWDTVSQLDLDQINHSNDPKVLAISLPEVYQQAGDKLPPKSSMLTALKNSIIPRFKDSNHAINSRLTGSTKKTWVFLMPNDEEA